MSSRPPAERLEAAPTIELGHDPDETVAPAVPPRRRWSSPGSWTLRSKLVASMLVLFTVVSIVTGAATIVFLGRYLGSQTDQQLQVSINRIVRAPGQPPVPSGSRRGPGEEGMTAYISSNTS